jgi:ADP-ribosylglycohydrolase
MIGGVIGDIIGSIYEYNNVKTTDFELFTEKSTFTDETIMCIAFADALLNAKPLVATIKGYGQRYTSPMGSYGTRFGNWLRSAKDDPYESTGNGSAARVVPVGFMYNTLEETLAVAKQTADITHNSKEGVAGAQAVAAAVFMARTGSSKAAIKKYIAEQFRDYNMDRTVEQIRPKYRWCELCKCTVPEAIIAFLDSENFEHAIRLAISLGGDSDTLACITGGIAEAFYKQIPENLITESVKRLTPDLKAMLDTFEEKYGVIQKTEISSCSF